MQVHQLASGSQTTGAFALGIGQAALGTHSMDPGMKSVQILAYGSGIPVTGPQALLALRAAIDFALHGPGEA